MSEEKVELYFGLTVAIPDVRPVYDVLRDALIPSKTEGFLFPTPCNKVEGDRDPALEVPALMSSPDRHVQAVWPWSKRVHLGFRVLGLRKVMGFRV